VKKTVLFIGVAAVLAGGVVVARRLRHAPGAPILELPQEATYRSAVALDFSEMAYDGRLQSGWEDWGWGRHDLSSLGPAKIVFTGYGGLILHHQPFAVRFGGVSFRYKLPRGWDEDEGFLFVTLSGLEANEAHFPKVNVELRHTAKLDEGWREVLIPWAEVNPTGAQFERIMIGARRQVGGDWVLLDKIGLTKVTELANRSAMATLQHGSLAVRCEEPARPINPLIYGVSMGAWATGATANRIGGNPITRLNWDIGNVWNTGNDWFFENVKGTNDKVWDWVSDAAKAGVQTALVVPMIGWVAKDAQAVGFPRGKFPPQQSYDQFRQDAGNGKAANGSLLTPGPATETSIAAPPELIGRWVKNMRQLDEKRGARGVSMYILDNEPTLWDVTHRDVHPDPLTYDELLERTLQYAAAVREADPDVLIAGPAEWGWSGYLYSAKDRVAGFVVRPDRRAHGDLPLIPWYLRRLADHERTTGQRLLDVLDVHFYPAAPGIYGAGARTDSEGAALRIRSTRALWDPSYRDESWINDSVRLIPRLREWVATNYPGRKLSLGEWSFGADEHLSGGIATAEALGRFGQEGLDAAFFWGGPKIGTPAYWAFRVFRNFDGNGARFLDLSVPTRSAGGVSLFASRSEDGAHLVIVMIGLTDRGVRAELDTTSCGTLLSRRSFTYAGGNEGIVEDPALAKSPPEFEEVGPWTIRVLDLTFRPPPPPPP
jgi:hypothetical protein